ncbi:MAG TPA: hypothetical protein VJ869_08760 [Sphaerochaeta sp.]|nr:hypothetical protein [Sphaerochaeta sp.]
MSILDSIQMLELRTKKAAGLIAMLRKEKGELQERFDLVNTHNAELEEYVEKFTTSNRLIEESIASAMENLSTIEGLDDILLMDDTALELEAAEGFSAGDAFGAEDIDVEILMEESPSL